MSTGPVGDIGRDTFRSLRNFIESQTVSIDYLTVNIDSGGGDTAAGIAIYNYLKNQPYDIVTNNLGEVSSAALLVYLAGKTRTAEPISKFMIHAPTINCSDSMNYHRLQELLATVNFDIQNYAAIVDAETSSLNGKVNVLDYLQGKCLVIDSREAFSYGITTEMTKTPPKCPSSFAGT